MFSAVSEAILCRRELVECQAAAFRVWRGGEPLTRKLILENLQRAVQKVHQEGHAARAKGLAVPGAAMAFLAEADSILTREIDEFSNHSKRQIDLWAHHKGERDRAGRQLEDRRHSP